MGLKDLLSFAAIAAIINIIGNILVFLMKDVVGIRSFEKWKNQQRIAEIHQKYKKPILLSAEELSGRCYEIAEKQLIGPRDKIGIETISLESGDNLSNNSINYHYIRYRYMSDIYRLCSFLGWIELYRRDLSAVGSETSSEQNRIFRCIKKINADIADGQLNVSPDRENWRDALIFREEQRAIGHRMISGSGGETLLDFGSFCEILEKDPIGSSEARWFLLAAKFFSNISAERDFRNIRMRRLIIHLTHLRQTLQHDSVWPPHVKGAKDIATKLNASGHMKDIPHLK